MTATNARRVNRDHDRHAHEATMRHSGEMRLLELARLGASALVSEFPDEPNAFDMALTVVRALDADGIVFARMGACSGDADSGSHEAGA